MKDKKKKPHAVYQERSHIKKGEKDFVRRHIKKVVIPIITEIVLELLLKAATVKNTHRVW
ncbi:MAG: hypothetical protein HGA97_05695 [Chlorobiaceae bacterium]|jgi:hypothetical protein|nr:hypothetical protein [Chlorobiaceae bacterium]